MKYCSFEQLQNSSFSEFLNPQVLKAIEEESHRTSVVILQKDAIEIYETVDRKLSISCMNDEVKIQISQSLSLIHI